MDDDARRYKNASEAQTTFKKGRVIILDQQDKEKEEQKTSASLEQGQQEKKEKDHRDQSLKEFTCQLGGLSYFYKQRLSKHKRNLIIKCENNKR